MGDSYHGNLLQMKKKKERGREKKKTKFKAALVAQRNCRPYYGFWHPPFPFYLFQLTAPGDKPINLNIPRGAGGRGHGSGNAPPGLRATILPPWGARQLHQGDKSARWALVGREDIWGGRRGGPKFSCQGLLGSCAPTGG